MDKLFLHSCACVCAAVLILIEVDCWKAKHAPMSYSTQTTFLCSQLLPLELGALSFDNCNIYDHHNYTLFMLSICGFSPSIRSKPLR